MSAHHLNVNRASCRGATYRVAGQASNALVAHFYYIVSDARAHSIVDTEPSIAETVDAARDGAPNRTFQLGTAGQCQEEHVNWRSGLS